MNRAVYNMTKRTRIDGQPVKYTARIYRDKVVVIVPHVKWVAKIIERRETIRDPELVTAIIKETACGDNQEAWRLIAGKVLSATL